MDNKEIDILIKQSLSNTAARISPKDSFSHIQSEIKKARNNNDQSFFGKTFTFKFRRTAAGFICGIFICAGLSFTFSEEVRATAVDTINKIKTIFVVDKVNGEYRVVEKSITEAKEPYFAVGTSTTLSETEIENIVGFKIHFSDSIEGYKLVDRGMGLILQKKINYETSQRLQTNMMAAIDDENEFKKLAQFKPLRDVSGAYKSSEGTIFIEVNNGKTWQSDLMHKSNNIIDVKIGDLNGKWVELPLPIYPIKEANGSGGFDFSQKPTEIKIMHALIWKVGNINYMLTTYDKNSEQPLENMLKTAQAFIINMNSSKDFKSTVLYAVQADTISDNSMNEMVNNLKTRYEAFGFKDVAVKRDGEKQIKVSVTGDQELSSISIIAGNQNQLKFVGPDDKVELTGADIKGAAVSNSALLIQFTNEGKGKLLDATTKLTDKQLKIFLDNKLLTAPVVRAPITDGRIMLTGLDNIEEMKRLSTIFKSGKSLEFQLKVVTIKASE